MYINQEEIYLSIIRDDDVYDNFKIQCNTLINEYRRDVRISKINKIFKLSDEIRY